MRARPGRVRLLLVDDHEIARLGLAELLKRRTATEVVGETVSAQAAAEARRLKPDVVLVSLRLPDAAGLEACREIKASASGASVLFLASCTDDDAAAATLLARAAGYVPRDSKPQALVRAIEWVAAGRSILDAGGAEAARGRVQSLLQQPARRMDDLSPQESRVLALVVEGKTNKEIARMLQLSDKTVKNYLSNAFQKLQVGRRSHAAILFRRRTDRA